MSLSYRLQKLWMKPRNWMLSQSTHCSCCSNWLWWVLMWSRVGCCTLQVIIIGREHWVCALIFSIDNMTFADNDWGSEKTFQTNDICLWYNCACTCLYLSHFSYTIQIMIVLSVRPVLYWNVWCDLWFVAKDILQNMCSEVAKLENTDKEAEAQKLICQAAYMAYEACSYKALRFCCIDHYTCK